MNRLLDTCVLETEWKEIAKRNGKECIYIYIYIYIYINVYINNGEIKSGIFKKRSRGID